MARFFMPTNYRLIIRLIALVLTVSFLATDLAYAASFEGAQNPASAQELLTRDPLRLEIPSQYARLQEVHQGKNGTLLIHIQDAHSNLSGQENLAGALDAILSRYKVDLVLVEGGEGDVSLTPLKEAATADVWKKVAKSFLIEGKLSGEEYLNLASDHPMRIQGIEDETLYFESLRAYADLASHREKTLEYLARIRRSVEKIKQKIYPSELLDYEKNEYANFESKFEALLKLSTPEGFPSLQKLARLKEEEKRIDFDLANLEQAALIEDIIKRGGKGDLKTHLEAARGAKDDKLFQYTHFQNILDIARAKNVPLSKYPNYLKYGEYLKEFSLFDLEAVLEEMERFENGVYPTFLTTQDQRLIRAVDRHLALLQTAFQIRMTTKEFETFRTNDPDFGTIPYLSFVNRKLAELGYAEDLIAYENVVEEGKKALEAFYGSVTKRDFAFIENTNKILKEKNEKVAVLISGGYHTPHLKELFKEKGYSYAVLTPVVTQETIQAKYERLLLAPLQNGKKILASQNSSWKKSDGIRRWAAAQFTDGRIFTRDELVIAAQKLAGARLADIRDFNEDEVEEKLRVLKPPSKMVKLNAREGFELVKALLPENQPKWIYETSAFGSLSNPQPLRIVREGEQIIVRGEPGTMQWSLAEEPLIVGKDDVFLVNRKGEIIYFRRALQLVRNEEFFKRKKFPRYLNKISEVSKDSLLTGARLAAWQVKDAIFGLKDPARAAKALMEQPQDLRPQILKDIRKEWENKYPGNRMKIFIDQFTEHGDANRALACFLDGIRAWKGKEFLSVHDLAAEFATALSRRRASDPTFEEKLEALADADNAEGEKIEALFEKHIKYFSEATIRWDLERNYFQKAVDKSLLNQSLAPLFQKLHFNPSYQYLGDRDRSRFANIFVMLFEQGRHEAVYQLVDLLIAQADPAQMLEVKPFGMGHIRSNAWNASKLLDSAFTELKNHKEILGTEDIEGLLQDRISRYDGWIKGVSKDQFARSAEAVGTESEFSKLAREFKDMWQLNERGKTPLKVKRFPALFKESWINSGFFYTLRLEAQSKSKEALLQLAHQYMSERLWPVSKQREEEYEQRLYRLLVRESNLNPSGARLAEESDTTRDFKNTVKSGGFVSELAFRSQLSRAALELLGPENEQLFMSSGILEFMGIAFGDDRNGKALAAIDIIEQASKMRGKELAPHFRNIQLKWAGQAAIGWKKSDRKSSGARLAQKQDIDRLRQVFQEGNSEASQEAFGKLKAMGAAAVPVWSEILKNSNNLTHKKLAAEVLMSQWVAALPKLIEILMDKTDSISQIYAENAIVGIGSKALVYLDGALAQSKDEDIRKQITEVIGQISRSRARPWTSPGSGARLAGTRPPQINAVLTDQSPRSIQNVMEAFLSAAREVTLHGRSADLRPVISLAKDINPQFKTRIPLDRLETADFDALTYLFSALERQIFLPAGHVVGLSLQGGSEPFIHFHGLIKEKTWQKLPDYLGQTLWAAEAMRTKELFGHDTGVIAMAFDEFAFVDPELAESDAKLAYYLIKQGVPTIAYPLRRLGPWLSQAGIQDARAYARYFNLNRKRHEEIRHAKDHLFKAEWMRKRMGVDPEDYRPAMDTAYMELEALLKPSSIIRRHFLEKTDLRRNHGALSIVCNLVNEYSGELGGIISEIEEHLSAGNKALAYAAFLDFIGFQMGSSEIAEGLEHGKTSIKGEQTLRYGGVANWLTSGIHDVDPRIDSAGSLLRVLEQGPEHPAERVLDLLKKVYAMDFWTDEERASKLAAGARLAADPETKKLFKGLKLNDLDEVYAWGLFQKWLHPAEAPSLERNFTASCQLSKEDRVELLGRVDYLASVNDTERISETSDVVLTQYALDGGFGKNVEREEYIRETLGEDRGLGAKGTDLSYDLLLDARDEQGRPIKKAVRLSVAEIKLLRAFHDRAFYGGLNYQPLVSEESIESYRKLYAKPYLFDLLDDRILVKRTYEEAARDLDVKLGHLTAERPIPVVDIKERRLSDGSTFTGGHGRAGVYLMYGAYKKDPLSPSQIHISAFFNGDGVSNAPNQAIVRQMKEKNIPIAMISTERTSIDRKGGIIGLQKKGDRIRKQLMELAQARKQGPAEEKLFQAIGLPGGPGEAGQQDFNTNVALVNDSLLSELLKELVARKIVTEEELVRIVSPDLIEKDPVMKDGKQYLPLEGAIGSALLNLDAFFEANDAAKELLGEKKIGKLLQIIYVKAEDRTDFFTPVKNSFDFWFQSYSDFYFVDTEKWVLRNTREGKGLPVIDVPGQEPKKERDKTDEDRYYAKVQNLIKSFGRASTRDLESLTIRGIVEIKDAVLRGTVKIINESGKSVNLNDAARKAHLPTVDGKLLFENVEVRIDAKGRIALRPFGWPYEIYEHQFHPRRTLKAIKVLRKNPFLHERFQRYLAEHGSHSVYLDRHVNPQAFLEWVESSFTDHRFSSKIDAGHTLNVWLKEIRPVEIQAYESASHPLHTHSVLDEAIQRHYRQVLYFEDYLLRENYHGVQIAPEVTTPLFLEWIQGIRRGVAHPNISARRVAGKEGAEDTIYIERVSGARLAADTRMHVRPLVHADLETIMASSRKFDEDFMAFRKDLNRKIALALGEEGGLDEAGRKAVRDELKGQIDQFIKRLDDEVSPFYGEVFNKQLNNIAAALERQIDAFLINGESKTESGMITLPFIFLRSLAKREKVANLPDYFRDRLVERLREGFKAASVSPHGNRIYIVNASIGWMKDDINSFIKQAIADTTVYLAGKFAERTGRSAGDPWVVEYRGKLEQEFLGPHSSSNLMAQIFGSHGSLELKEVPPPRDLLDRLSPERREKLESASLDAYTHAELGNFKDEIDYFMKELGEMGDFRRDRMKNFREALDKLLGSVENFETEIKSFDSWPSAKKNVYYNAYDAFLSYRREVLTFVATYYVEQDRKEKKVVSLDTRDQAVTARARANYYLELLLEDLYRKLYQRLEVVEIPKLKDPKLRKVVDRATVNARTHNNIRILGDHEARVVIKTELYDLGSDFIAEYFAHLREGLLKATPLQDYHSSPARWPRPLKRMKEVRGKLADFKGLLKVTKGLLSSEEVAAVWAPVSQLDTYFYEYASSWYHAAYLAYSDPRIGEIHQYATADEVVRFEASGEAARFIQHIRGLLDLMPKKVHPEFRDNLGLVATMAEPGAVVSKHQVGDEIGFVIHGKDGLYWPIFVEFKNMYDFFREYPMDRKDSVMGQLLTEMDKAAKKRVGTLDEQSIPALMLELRSIVQRIAGDKPFEATLKIGKDGDVTKEEGVKERMPVYTVAGADGVHPSYANFALQSEGKVLTRADEKSPWIFSDVQMDEIVRVGKRFETTLDIRANYWGRPLTAGQIMRNPGMTQFLFDEQDVASQRQKETQSIFARVEPQPDGQIGITDITEKVTGRPSGARLAALSPEVSAALGELFPKIFEGLVARGKERKVSPFALAADPGGVRDSVYSLISEEDSFAALREDGGTYALAALLYLERNRDKKWMDMYIGRWTRRSKESWETFVGGFAGAAADLVAEARAIREMRHELAGRMRTVSEEEMNKLYDLYAHDHPAVGASILSLYYGRRDDFDKSNYYYEKLQSYGDSRNVFNNVFIDFMGFEFEERYARPVGQSRIDVAVAYFNDPSGLPSALLDLTKLMRAVIDISAFLNGQDDAEDIAQWVRPYEMDELFALSRALAEEGVNARTKEMIRRVTMRRLLTTEIIDMETAVKDQALFNDMEAVLGNTAQNVLLRLRDDYFIRGLVETFKTGQLRKALEIAEGIKMKTIPDDDQEGRMRLIEQFKPFLSTLDTTHQAMTLAALFEAKGRLGRAVGILKAAIAVQEGEEAAQKILHDGRAIALKSAIDRLPEWVKKNHENTAFYSVLLGMKNGFDAARLRALYAAAYLHDVGKVNIPDAILNKEGELTPEERTVMEEHLTHSLAIIGATPGEVFEEAGVSKEAVLKTISAYHEQPDGSGYPDHLRSRRISLDSAIVHAADAVDAMLAVRPYQPEPQPIAQVIGQLRHSIRWPKRAKFEPVVAKTFLEILSPRDRTVGPSKDAKGARLAKETAPGQKPGRDQRLYDERFIHAVAGHPEFLSTSSITDDEFRDAMLETLRSNDHDLKNAYLVAIESFVKFDPGKERDRAVIEAISDLIIRTGEPLEVRLRALRALSAVGKRHPSLRSDTTRRILTQVNQRSEDHPNAFLSGQAAESLAEMDAAKELADLKPVEIELDDTNHLRRVLTQMILFIEKDQKLHGKNGRVVGIAAAQSSFIDALWTPGSDVDGLKIFLEGVSAEDLERYRSRFENIFFEIGMEGLKEEKNIFKKPEWIDVKNQPVHAPTADGVVLYDRSSGHSPVDLLQTGWTVNDAQGTKKHDLSRTAKMKVRKLLFDYIRERKLTPPQIELIRRVHLAYALHEVFYKTFERESSHEAALAVENLPEAITQLRELEKIRDDEGHHLLRIRKFFVDDKELYMVYPQWLVYPEAYLRNSSNRVTVVEKKSGEPPAGARLAQQNPSVGTNQGRRDVQEDVAYVGRIFVDGLPNGQGQLMAVFDGHSDIKNSRHGGQMAERSASQVKRIFRQALVESRGDAEKAMVWTIERLHVDLEKHLAHLGGGTTASIVYVTDLDAQGDAKAIAAALGDSAILIQDAAGMSVGLPILNNKKMEERENIKRRAQELGKSIYEDPEHPGYLGYWTSRGSTFFETSRGLGDFDLPFLGRTPIVRTLEVKRGVSSIVLATDGVPVRDAVGALLGAESAQDLVDRLHTGDNRTAVIWRSGARLVADESQPPSTDIKKLYQEGIGTVVDNLESRITEGPNSVQQKIDLELRPNYWRIIGTVGNDPDYLALMISELDGLLNRLEKRKGDKNVDPATFERLNAFVRGLRAHARARERKARKARGPSGARLAQNFIGTTEAVDAKDPETLILIARALLDLKKISRTLPFNFKLGNALITAELDEKRGTGKVYFYNVGKEGKPFGTPFTQVKLTEDIVRQARALKDRESVVRVKISARSEALEAFADDQNATGAARQFYQQLRKNKAPDVQFNNERTAVLRFTTEKKLRPEKIELYRKQLQTLHSIAGKKVLVQFAQIRRNGKIILYGPSDPTPSKGEDYALFHLSDLSRRALKAAKLEGAGFASVKGLADDETVIPFVAQGVFLVAMGRFSGYTNSIQQLWRNVRGGNALMDLDPESFGDIRKVQKIDLDRYSKLQLRTIARIAWEKVLEFTRLALQAVGAAA